MKEAGQEFQVEAELVKEYLRNEGIEIGGIGELKEVLMNGSHPWDSNPGPAVYKTAALAS